MQEETKRAIDKALEKWKTEYINSLKGRAYRSYVQGAVNVHTLLGAVPEMDLINKEALEYAQEYGKMLEEEGASVINGEKVYWMRDFTKTQREEIFNEIEKGIATGRSLADTSKEIRSFFDESKAHASMVARTETFRVLSDSNLVQYKKYNIEEVEWSAAMDERTDDCAFIIESDGRTYNGCGEAHGSKWRTDNPPQIPAHPNCRCMLIPVVEEIPEEPQNR